MKWLDLNEDLNDKDDDDDDDDDDDANSKDAEVCHRWSTNNSLQFTKSEIPIKGRKKLSCRHKRQIREDKSVEQKVKSYQWLLYVRIKFVW